MTRNGLLALLLLPPLVAPGGAMGGEAAVVELGAGLHLLLPGPPRADRPVVALVGDEGVLLVDPGPPGQVASLLTALGVEDPARLRFVVDTYARPGPGGEPGFGPRVELVSGVARGAQLSTTDELRLHSNGQRILVRTLPRPGSRTASDLIVHFEDAGVLYAGGHWFDGSFPLVDLDAGGDLEGYLANIRWLLESFPPDTRVVPGHLRPGQPGVRGMADYLEWWRGLYASVGVVREGMGGGLSLEEIQAAGYGGELDRWGDPPAPVSTDGWIEFVYRYYEGRD